jgi:hypothetical protein
MSNETFIPVVSAIIALFACGGAWLSFIIQRRSAVETIAAQIDIGARNSRASVVSANRQRWIDAIRDDLTELLVSGAEHANVKRRIDNASRLGDLTPDLQKTLKAREYELIRLIMYSQTRIKLRLNHSEADHLAFIDAMRNYELAQDPSKQKALEDIARKIFSHEWARLKLEATGRDPFVKEAVKVPAKRNVFGF